MIIRNVLAAVALICAPAYSVGCQPPAASWRVAGAWLNALEPEEQIVALLLIRKQLNDDLFRILADPEAKKPEGLRWAVSVQLFGCQMLSMLATKSPEFAAATAKIADDLSPISRGEAELNSYAASVPVTQVAFNKILSKIDLQKGERVQRVYGDLIDKSATHIIVQAKFASSKVLKDYPSGAIYKP